MQEVCVSNLDAGIRNLRNWITVERKGFCAEIQIGSEDMGSHGEKHEKHRQRMIQKSLESGLEFMPEHEQLEMLLYAVIPRGNTNELAIDLLKKFGTLYAVVTAVPAELMEVKGVGKRAAEFLHSLPDYLGIVQRSQMFGDNKALVLQTTEEMGNYAQTLFNHKMVEAFYLISLSHSGRVIRFDKISEGTLDETAVYVRRIAKRAILNDAAGVILTHNHPGGKMIPSVSDVQSSREIVESLHILGVKVLDHIIVSGCEWVSMKELGTLPYSV